MKAPFGGQPSSAAFGLALVIANILLGFLFFYLWARSLLERNLELANGDEQEATPQAVIKTTVVPAPAQTLAPEQPPAAIKP
jgi:hypothetical protein